MKNKGRPTAYVVVAEGTWTSPRAVTDFALSSSEGDLPPMLHDLASGLRSRLNGLECDRVVVRRAEQPKRPSNKEGPRTRLLAEGALVAVAHELTNDVLLGSGKDLAGRTPAANKDGLDEHASTVLADQDHGAAAAALAGLA